MSIGGGKSSGSQSDPAASTLARIAEGFATETQGLRQGLIGQLQGILTNPTGAPGQTVATAAPVQTVATAAAPTAAPSTAGLTPEQTWAQNYAATKWPQPAPATTTTPGTAPVAGQTTLIPGGGIQVPLLAAAEEMARRAGSKATEESQNELSRTNLAGTPFGQNILATSRREGNLAASNAKTDVMKSLFNLIPNFVLGQSQTALSGLSGAVGGNVSGKGKGFGAGASK